MPARRDDGGGLPPSVDDLIGSLSAEEVRQLLPQLLALGAPDTAQQLSAPRPSRLRPARDEVLTYQLRVELHDARPPIWRRLQLRSDLTLDVVHTVLQTVMGWTDSHLHGFSSGGDLYDRDAERYMTEYDLAEGEEGVAETDVRLDQVLQDPGDRLFYEYDFGDSWTHRIVLEEVRARRDDEPAALCVAGRRACPPEDVGGIPGYDDLLRALGGTAPGDEGVEEQLEWLGADFDPAYFSVDDVNEALKLDLLAAQAADVDLPEAVASLLQRAGQAGRPLLAELVSGAHLDDDVPVTVEVAEPMVAPYAWFLRRLGTDGVKLTSAGYLPPALVAEVVAELDLAATWIGAGNREHQTYPVLELRESMQALGLVKKRSGRLSATAAGRRLVDDPVALWRHVASRLPLGQDEAQREAGMLALLVAASEVPLPEEPADAVATVMTSLGWRSGMTPVSSRQALTLVRPTWDVLHRMGAVGEWSPHASTQVATPQGRLLARAALRTR